MLPTSLSPEISLAGVVDHFVSVYMSAVSGSTLSCVYSLYQTETEPRRTRVVILHREINGYTAQRIISVDAFRFSQCLIIAL
jgi:hypothetical protein